MAEEIFGPILPVLRVRDMDEAIAFVNRRPKPLSLYLFTRDRSVQERFVQETSSGCVTINHTLVYFFSHSLPFGGVGASGMGNYHGRATFETFSHKKAVFKRALPLEPGIMYPPYSETKKRWIRRLV
jgi:aldehyde dehydrogenase (NAD+)